MADEWQIVILFGGPLDGKGVLGSITRDVLRIPKVLEPLDIISATQAEYFSPTLPCEEYRLTPEGLYEWVNPLKREA